MMKFLTRWFPTPNNSVPWDQDPTITPRDDDGIRLHKHSIFTARVNNPPQNKKECERWFNRLIKKIDMKVMVKPKAYYCNEVGNRGLTCTAIIETSHIALHAWDECSPGLVELDVFSCKDYNVNDVLVMLKEFQVTSLNFKCFDRTHGLREDHMYFVHKTIAGDKTTHGIHVGKGYSDNDLPIDADIPTYHELLAVFPTRKQAECYLETLI